MTELITEWCPRYLVRGTQLCQCKLCKAREQMRPSQSVDHMLAVAGLIAALYAWRLALSEQAWTHDFVSLGVSFFKLAALKSK